jgi:hypothetical protein
MFPPILKVLPCQFHQYIGGTLPAPPIGEESQSHTVNLKFRRFFKLFAALLYCANWSAAPIYCCNTKKIKMFAAPRLFG